MTKFGKAHVPTDSEIKRLLVISKSGNHGKRNLAIISFSYRLGFRAKELAALHVEDVIDGHGRIREECELKSSMTKGGKPRIAYLTNPIVKQSLREYIDERKAEEGILFNIKSALFKSQKHNHFDPNTMQQLLARLHKLAGIARGRSHSGRRWFATELISKGIDIKSVSVLMGHSSISMTAQYAEDNPQKLRKIAAELV
jgi:integrase/recombinase XerD